MSDNLVNFASLGAATPQGHAGPKGPGVDSLFPHLPSSTHVRAGHEAISRYVM